MLRKSCDVRCRPKKFSPAARIWGAFGAGSEPFDFRPLTEVRMVRLLVGVHAPTPLSPNPCAGAVLPQPMLSSSGRGPGRTFIGSMLGQGARMALRRFIIVPGVIFAYIAIYVVSIMSAAPADEITTEFDKVENHA